MPDNRTNNNNNNNKNKNSGMHNLIFYTKIDNPLTYLIYFNLITLKDLFAPLTSCFSTNQKSKLLLPLAPSLMLLLQYGTLYLLTYVTLHLFIHSPLTSKPTFSHLSSFAHSY